MRTILVTGSDTGIGKTRVAAALVRMLAAGTPSVQIVKPVQTGSADTDDVAEVRRLAEAGEAHTLFSFKLPLSPVASAAAEGHVLSFDSLLAKVRALSLCDWRVIEGAGGIATPLEQSGRDWSDFAAALNVDFLIVVVADRLGAINQGRLAWARALASGRPATVWLNTVEPLSPEVAEANRAGLRDSGVPIGAELAPDAHLPRNYQEVARSIQEMGTSWPSLAAARSEQKAERASEEPMTSTNWKNDYRAALEERERQHRRRHLPVTVHRYGEVLNLIDNDYLALAHDSTVVEALARAARAYGTSAAASPLITGWHEPHAQLLEALGAWHRFPHGMLWSSGYAANNAILTHLPKRGDLVLADRLVHHSLLSGLQQSGAKFHRYDHLCLDHLERLLVKADPRQKIFVVTESIFSMDGDHPDLARIAELKRQRDFCWILDEAHALGWFGPDGAGLARAYGVEQAVDVFVATLGKTLASGGAYSLFRDETIRDYLVNFAGEFIYSTALPPANAAAALAALGRTQALASQQAEWQMTSRAFRAALQQRGWRVADGVSPIVPLQLDGEEEALRLAAALRREGVLVAPIRPPTVPAGTSRLRMSLKRTFGKEEQIRVITALESAKGS